MPKFLRLLSVFIFAVAGAYFAGDFSTLIAYRIQAMGINLPVREFINAAIAFGLFAIYFKTQKTLKMNWGDFGGFSAGLETIIMILSVVWGALTYFKAVGDFKPIPNYSLLMLSGSLGLMFLHAIAEQILLQGALQLRLKEDFGAKTAMVAAAIGFTALQVAQGYFQPIYIFNSFCFGLLLAILYEKHGFISAVAAHAVWTFLEIIVKNSVVTMNYHYNAYLWRGQDSYGSPLFGALCLISALLMFGLKQNNLGEDENIL